MDSVVVQQVVQSVQVPSARSVWEMSGVIALAGAAGGIVNALLNSGNGYSLRWPRAATNGILQLGIAGNIVLGAFAALITWGLYGPLTDAVLLGSVPAGQVAANLTIITVTGAILAGVGGARVISNEVDKRLLRSAGAGAAQQPANTQLAVDIATLAPAKALANAMDAAKDQAAGNQAAAAQAGTGQAGTGQAGDSLVREGPGGPGTGVGGGGRTPEAVGAGAPEAVGAGAPEAETAGSKEAVTAGAGR